jgi:hypothetical protein
LSLQGWFFHDLFGFFLALGNVSAVSVYEATVAARDTAREIRDTTRDLKEDGIIGSTASAIQETTVAARGWYQNESQFVLNIHFLDFVI